MKDGTVYKDSLAPDHIRNVGLGLEPQNHNNHKIFLDAQRGFDLSCARNSDKWPN